MDELTARPYCEQTDHQRVDDLFFAYRASPRVGVYPTIWRLHLLLSSRMWEPTYDTQVWEDTSGRMVGFALLWRWRVDDPYLVLDQFVHPHDLTASLADAILRWAMQRAKTLAEHQTSPIIVFATTLDPAVHIDPDWSSYGFTPSPPDLDASMSRSCDRFSSASPSDAFRWLRHSPFQLALGRLLRMFYFPQGMALQ